MSKKTKRVFAAVLACLLVLATLLSLVTPLLADELSDLEGQQEELEAQAAYAEALAAATEAELATAQAQLDEATKELDEINAQINEVGERIIELNKKIKENEVKLAETEAELAQAQEDLKVYYAALKGRIQMMYESDRGSYLEILLSAGSISEFFSKLEYISQMVEYDNNIMEQLDACREKIQTSKEAVEKTKAELEADRQKEQEEQDALMVVQAEKQEVVAQLEENKVAYALLLQEQETAWYNSLAAVEANKEAIQNEKDRIAAEEEAARLEQERLEQERLEQERLEQEKQDQGSDDEEESDEYTDNDSSEEETDEDEYYDSSSAPSGSDSERALANGYYSTWPGIGSGVLSWPVDCYVLSSLYGPRTHPISGEYKNHGGIDFAADYGSNIYACGSGTVIEAYTADTWGWGWGYYVVIQHDNGLTTLYAHCSSVAVSEGERVSAGQTIAYVGSTGYSTGSHLHLEVYDGGVKVDPEDYL